MLINNNKIIFHNIKLNAHTHRGCSTFSEGRKHKLEDTHPAIVSAYLFSNYTDKDVSICSEPKEK